MVNDTPGDPPKPATDFLATEYKALREEIKALVAENQTLERFAGGAVAAAITWILTAKGIPESARSAAWLVPPLIAALAALRCYGIGFRIEQIASYIRSYEAWLMAKGATDDPTRPRGWETNLAGGGSLVQATERPAPKYRDFTFGMQKAPFYTTASLYWALLFLAGPALLLFSLHGKPPEEKSYKQATVTVSDPSGSSSTVTVPLGFTIEVKRPAN